MSLIDLELVKRLSKGSPLTAQEMDDNLCKLQDVLQALADLLTSVIGDDGKLADCTVQTDTLCDRVVTQAKRAWGSDFIANDTGTANAVTIEFSPAVTAYTESALVAAKIATANTGAATLNINGVGATAIKKNGTDDLEAEDLEAGKIALFVYDGSTFQLLNPSKLQQGAIVTYEGEANAALSTGTTNSEVFTHGLVDSAGDPVIPTGYEVELICQSADLGYSADDRIPLSQILGNYVTDEEAPISVTVTDTSVSVIVELSAGWTLLAKPQPTSPDGASVILDPTKWKLAAKAWYFSSAGVIPVFASPSSGTASAASSTLRASTLVSVPNTGSPVTWSHGQSRAPDIIQARLVVNTLTSIPAALNHLAVGDEIEFSVYTQDNPTGSARRDSAKILISNASEVKFISPMDDTSAGNGSFVLPRNDGSVEEYTPTQVQANFQLKLVAIWVN